MKDNLLSLQHVGMLRVGDVIATDDGDQHIAEILRWREDDKTVTQVITDRGHSLTGRDDRPLENHAYVGKDR